MWLFMLRNSQWISLPCSFPIFPTAHENLAFASSLGNQFHRSARSISKSNLLSFFLPSFLFLQISSDDSKFLALIVTVNIRSLRILSSSFMTCWTVLTSQLSHFFSRKCLTQLNWNIRIVEAGKYFKRSSCPASLPKATSKGCSEPCQVVFWTSPKMESPQSQADFLQCLTTLAVKSFFLCLKGMPHVSVFAHCLFDLSLGTTGKSLVSSSLLPPPSGVYTHGYNHPGPLISRLNSPSCLGLSLYVLCHWPTLNHLCDPSLDSLSKSVGLCTGSPALDTAICMSQGYLAEKKDHPSPLICW